MDKDDIEQAMQKITHEAQQFKEESTNELALELDKDISIIRFIIGEENFLSLHYFRRIHEDAIKWLDANYWKQEKQTLAEHNNV